MTAPIVSAHTRLGVTLLGVAAVLGVLTDQLLRAVPWGLNLTVCTLALVAAGVWIARRHHVPISGDSAWLTLSGTLCAVAFVRRDSPVLRTLDGVTLTGVLALTALAVQGDALRRRGVSAYLLAGVMAGGHAVLGVFSLLLHDISWPELTTRDRWRTFWAVCAGVLVATPLLLVFGGLFVSADAAFAALASSIRVDIGSMVGHIALTGLGATLAAGYLRGAFFGRATHVAAGERLSPPSIPFLSSAIVLSLLNGLFVLFVAVQARWLFGGARLVREITGLTLAQYARRGFFELVTAAALVLPVLLVADWATRREHARQEASFRALATLLVLLVGALLVSALQRMLLYVQAFGLTELRLYTTAFMVWLAGVFGWLVYTVLHGRRTRFAFGALLQAVAVLAGLHVANPDALIARVDAARPGTEVSFDAEYTAGRLSADAVPALLDALPRLGARERAEVARRLLTRWGGADSSDWRSWNWSAAAARRLVRARTQELVALRGPECPAAPDAPARCADRMD
jgi:Domain of unknown function (DUF4153)